jgi:peptidoglycan/LPS O-acetylase OafA/YrhL
MIKNEHFAGADGIRGLACLIVLITHAFSMFFASSAGLYLAGTGKIGVWLFFVLSAFLLTHKFRASGFSMAALAAYALGRTFRILPLFIIAVFVYLALGTAGINTLSDVWLAITFQSGYAHLWTIPVEFTFYAWLPLLAALLITARKHSITLASASAVALITVQQALWPFWHTEINAIETQWYVSCFTIGCYLATIINDIRGRISGRASNAICLLVTLGLILGSPGARHEIFGVPYDTALADKFVFIGAAWALFIIATIDLKGYFGSLVNSRFMRQMGAWSYSIYLFHWLVYMHSLALYPRNELAMLSAIIMSILIGAAARAIAFESHNG